MAVHVVTGSLGLAVEATLRHAGIAFDSVSGGVLRVVEGVVGAELERHPPLFEGKVTALREGGCWPAALGLGDGGWDHTFLREVHVPVLVHPQPALEHAMRDVSRAITLR
jgi:phosphoserine phosphatase